MSEDKARYRQHCATEQAIPIFSQSWWLDAAAGEDNWDVAIVEKNGSLMASLPFVVRKSLGMTILGQPMLTPALGPWLRPGKLKYVKEIAQQKLLLESLIDQLPAFHHYQQLWHVDRTNWLPFYWKGFKQTTGYTYILPDLSDEKVLWEDFSEKTRRSIRNASGRYHIRVRADAPFEELFAISRQVFARQSLPVPYPEAFARRLDEACAAHGARRIFIAEDDQGRHHAGVYLVWDRNSAYYLMGGGNPDSRSSGALSLCLWEAIRFASTVTRRFDFEGSVIESIEHYFRGFGAILTPYHSVSRTTSKALETLLFLRNLRNRKVALPERKNPALEEESGAGTA